MKVAKFGGSSVANAMQIRKVAAIIQEDANRRIIVVSASSIEVFFESLRQKRTDIRMIHADFIVRNSKQAV